LSTAIFNHCHTAFSATYLFHYHWIISVPIKNPKLYPYPLDFHTVHTSTWAESSYRVRWMEQKQGSVTGLSKWVLKT